MPSTERDDRMRTGPRRWLVAAVAAALAVITVVAGVSTTNRDPDLGPGPADRQAGLVPGPGPQPGQTAWAPADQPAEPSPGRAGSDEHPGLADPAAGAAAVGFVTAWARPDLPAEQWLAGLTEVTDPGYLETLASTDPSRVPATRITGPPAAVVTGAYYAEYAVGTDAGPVGIRVVYNGTIWQVVSARPLTPPRVRSGRTG